MEPNVILAEATGQERVYDSLDSPNSPDSLSMDVEQSHSIGCVCRLLPDSLHPCTICITLNCPVCFPPEPDSTQVPLSIAEIAQTVPNLFTKRLTGQKRGPRKWKFQNCRHVIVLGCGGVGYWLNVALAGAGLVQDITVYDPDTFEGGTGHLRLPKVGNHGIYKVQALKGFIQVVMGQTPPEIQAVRFEPSNVKRLKLNYKYLVVDCTDMGQAEKERLYRAVVDSGARYCRVSYDGEGIVALSHGIPIAASDDPGGYRRMPSLAQSLRAGGEGADFVQAILNGLEPEERNFEIVTERMEEVEEVEEVEQRVESTEMMEVGFLEEEAQA